MSSGQLEKSAGSTGILLDLPLDHKVHQSLTAENSLLGNRVSYLSNLTPMRGIAALLTVIFHINFFIGYGLQPASGSIIMHDMYLMVDFFFILSGFIMSHVYGHRFTSQVMKADFKKFTIARFSRVYPLHLATLIFTIFLYFLFARINVPKNEILQADNNLYSVFTNLLLLQAMNFNNWFTWVHASWSISTEWWAYMIFPFLVAPFSRLNSRGRMVICILCFAGYTCISLFLAPLVTLPAELPFPSTKPMEWSLNVAYQYGFARCICGFILGMITQLAFTDKWGQKILANGWTMVLLAAGVFFCMHFNIPALIITMFFPLLLLSGAYGSARINKIFATKPLQRLGDWSFSIYLTHQPLLILFTYSWSKLSPVQPNKLNQWEPLGFGLPISWMICFVLLIVIIFVGYLSYRFIENPSRRWLNSKAA